MALDLIASVLFSIIDILKGALVVSLPVFFIVLFAQFLRKKISEETNWSWTISAFATTFLVLYFLIAIAYFYPFLVASQEMPIKEIPEMFAPEIGSVFSAFIFGAIRSGFAALIASILIMPAEFVGLFIFEAVFEKKEKKQKWMKTAVAVYSTTLLCSVVLIFVIPEALTGFIYLLYFGL